MDIQPCLDVSWEALLLTIHSRGAHKPAESLDETKKARLRKGDLRACCSFDMQAVKAVLRRRNVSALACLVTGGAGSDMANILASHGGHLYKCKPPFYRW